MQRSVFGPLLHEEALSQDSKLMMQSSANKTILKAAGSFQNSELHFMP